MPPNPTTSPGRATYSNGVLIARLLALAWRHPGALLGVLALQAVLIALGLGAVNFVGLGIDYLQSILDPTAPSPAWWPGLEPSSHWSPQQVIGAIGALVLLFALGRGALQYLHAVAVSRLVHQHMLLALRTDLYDHLQRLSFRFFDTHGSGSLINRVIGDVQSIRVFIEGVMLQTLALLLTFAIYVVYMAWVSWPLTAVCLASTPLLWLLSYRFSQHARPLYLQSREIMDGLYNELSESIQGVQTIKGFGREPLHRDKFRRINDALRNQQRELFRRVSRFSPSIGLLSQLNIFILLLYGGWLVFENKLALGSGLVVFASLLQQFSAQVTKIAEIANSAQQSLSSARRLFEILDAKVEIASPAKPRPTGRLRGQVEFRSVSFGYDADVPVLHDISFRAPAGSCVALLGPTGSGKSTLLSLIARFYDPLKGTVAIDGCDLRDMNLHELRRQVGVVFQESFLFSDTVGANIAFGRPGAASEQIERAARVAAAHDFIQHLDERYDTHLGEAGTGLSGGQRQRIAIARALLLDPPILLMDDPTAAIDATTEHEIFHAMDRAIAGRTTFIVAHRFSTLRRANLVLVLDRGRIVQSGNHADLIGVEGPYRRAAALQLGALPPLAES